MTKPRRKMIASPNDFFPPKKRKPVPHEFVLDALASVSPRTNPMFGCVAVYVPDAHVKEKIVLILRDRPTAPDDNGVWLATTIEHHQSLRADFPSLRSIGVLGKDITGWQILPADSPDFEEAALRACDFVMARDPRIGKVPKTKRPKAGEPRRDRKAGKSKKQTQTKSKKTSDQANQPKTKAARLKSKIKAKKKK